ncbi:MAG: ABC-2 family transporter protein [Candidatus Woesebacteria bacterium]|jgi:ABC-2 type transport system permease protein
MNKYLTILRISWQSTLVYRLNTLMWRFRMFLTSLISISLWLVVFTKQQQFFHYQAEDMLSYIFLTSILQSLILSSAIQDLATNIYNGRISYLLIRPVNIFAFLLSQDLADKAKNIFFAIIELSLLYLIFQPQFYWPNLSSLLFFIISILLGFITLFIIMLLFGSIGFWSPETWAPRFLFFMIIQFTSGRLFPLDVLPSLLQKIIYLTPFPYLTFVQTQIFLERFSFNQSLSKVLIGSIWVIVLTIFLKIIWQKGMKNYSAVGQ